MTPLLQVTPRGHSASEAKVAGRYSTTTGVGGGTGRAVNVGGQPGRIVKEISIELPDGIVLRDLPKLVHASTADFEFNREWSLHEQTIVERPELRSTAGGGICSPETITAIANAVDEISNRVDPILRFERSTAKSD